MGVAIHPQNQSTQVIPLTGQIATREFRCQNAYGKGGVILINVIGAFTNQQETLTVAGTAELDGSCIGYLQGKLLPNGIIKFTFPLLKGATASDVAGLMRSLLTAIPEVVAHYTVSGAGADVVVEAINLARRDETLKIGLDASGTQGVQDGLSVDTTGAGTVDVTPTIEGLDPYTGDTYPLLTGVAMVAAGTQQLTIHPEIAAVANVSASELLPRYFKITMTHGLADNVLYSVTLNSNM